MSYSIIAALLLTVVALSSSTLHPNTERNVLARFYSEFTELYRSVTLKPDTSKSEQESSIEQYQFLFTEKEYLQISEESLTMLYTDVIERTIVYHPMPNFETIGSRYFYRRDPKENEAVEIELVDANDYLFREVRRPNRYFYLPSLSGLEYSTQRPVMPYYEVTFVCNSSLPKDPETQAPLLSYVDKSIRWSPRYLLDLPMFGTGVQSEMSAYADIRNYGEQSLVIKGAELTAGDVKLIQRPIEFLRTGSYGPNIATVGSPYTSITTFPHPLGEQASGTYVYQLEMPTSISLLPYSMKSIKFFESNVTVESFLYYSSVFSTVNSNGKLFKAYNITSLKTYIPNGRLTLREQGRFMGEINLPDLTAGETHTMTFGYDADVIYRRQVDIVDGNEHTDSVTYHVEYVFENYKSSRDVRLYFVESFSAFKYFQVKNISTSNGNKQLPDLVVYGTDLRGFMTIPCQHGQKVISYNVVMYRVKPRRTAFEQ